MVLECAIMELKENRKRLKLNCLNQVLDRSRYSSDGLGVSFDNTHTVRIHICVYKIAFAHTRSGPLEKRSNNVVDLSSRAGICYCCSPVSECLKLDTI
jgi:hypothetical protein